MTDTQTENDRLWKLIGDARLESDHSAANAIFREAEQLGLELHRLEPRNAEHCYAIALTYYHRLGAQDERRNCVEWLHKTAELAPKHPWVPLFLGYQFFDERRYPEAYAQFSRVDQSYFASIEQHWRNIKTDELMLVCLIRCQPSPVDASMLISVCDRYADADAIDRPAPTEIIRTLSETAARGSFTVSAATVASEACRLIQVCDGVSLFADEFAALESAAKAVG